MKRKSAGVRKNCIRKEKLAKTVTCLQAFYKPDDS